MDRTPNNDAPALAIDTLRFRYAREGDWIVDVGSLALRRGEQALVTGASGRGKSTLLHLIAGLIEPDAGTIRVGGTSVFDLGPGARDRFRGRAIGMIFQTYNLLHGFSALENVMMAMVVSDIPAREHRARAGALLDELGIDRHEADPERMSVGQRQRVAVARAIACEPVLVLADEPTASLDPESGRAAMDLIQSACRTHGAALLCASHDPAMGARFERVIALDHAVPGGAP